MTTHSVSPLELSRERHKGRTDAGLNGSNLKPTEEYERYPNCSAVSMTETFLQLRKLGKALQRMAGRQEKKEKKERERKKKNESKIKLLIQENNKMQDLFAHTYGSVTKDQSGPRGFVVKQGATTIHEDITAFTVSASSLTMAMEAVTHALRWIASRGDSQNTYANILTD